MLSYMPPISLGDVGGILSAQLPSVPLGTQGGYIVGLWITFSQEEVGPLVR